MIGSEFKSGPYKYTRYPCGPPAARLPWQSSGGTLVKHPKVSVYDWHVKTRGTEFADAHVKRYQLKFSKFIKTPAGRVAISEPPLKGEASRLRRRLWCSPWTSSPFAGTFGC